VQIPFTVDQFFGVMREFNAAVGPAPGVLLALTLAAVFLAVRPRRQPDVV
jgi:hypothetical protein